VTRGLALALLVLIAWVAPARAHQSSVTYSTATVDGASVDYRIRIAVGDLAEPAGRDPTATVAMAELDAATWAQVASYVTARVAISSETGPCPPTNATARADGDHAEVTWRATCAAPIATLTIAYDLFFDLDPSHDAALRVIAPGHEPADTILVADAARFVWDLSTAPPSGAWAFVRAGMHHVATGLDHVAFVLSLLIAVVIVGAGGGWERRAMVPAVRATAARVSAFTVAHSLTLVAAALGWVALPGRPVECAIAASIVWTAVAAAVRPDARGGWMIAFGFGLVHGLGFARMLAPLLPGDAVVVPLLCFNLGVELAQLAIVAVALPIAWGLAAAIGARAYRRYALPAAATVLGGFGLIWLIERLFAVTLLGL
jgi:hypothetical protein